MEHAADALKMAFALLVFAIAITTIFVMVAKVKTTSDVVMYYGDKTNFYSHYEDKSKDTNGNRIVGISDILATLYRYYKESVAVTVILDNNNPQETYYFDLGYEQMGITATGEKMLLVTDGNNNVLLKLSTQEDIEKNLGEFVWRKLITNHNINEDTTFTERFTEVPTSGIYDKGEDGSEIVLASGGKKVYITYTIR